MRMRVGVACCLLVTCKALRLKEIIKSSCRCVAENMTGSCPSHRMLAASLERCVFVCVECNYLIHTRSLGWNHHQDIQRAGTLLYQGCVCERESGS